MASSAIDILQHARRAVAKYRGDPYPETEASIAAAKADCEKERAKLRKELGLTIADDGRMSIPKLEPLNVSILDWDGGPSMARRIDCSEKVSALVEEYGLLCVIRAMRCELAVNGLYLRIVDDEQAGA